MSKTTIAVLAALAVGIAVGVVGAQMMNPAAETRPLEAKAAPAMPAHVQLRSPDAVGAQDVSGPYEVVKDWPQDLADASRPREVDLWRRARRLRREPRSRVPARRRRAAEHPASAGPVPDRCRSERAVPRRRSAVAQRQPGDASGQRRLASGCGEGHGGLERQAGAVPRARPRRALAPLDHRGQSRGQDHRGLDAVRQHVQASARRLHQPVRCGEARLDRR